MQMIENKHEFGSLNESKLIAMYYVRQIILTGKKFGEVSHWS